MKRAVKFADCAWRSLLFLNFEVDPELLVQRLPPGLELDFWNTRTYVSVVGFLFEESKVFGVSLPLHQSFEEINLRFYVRRKAEGKWKHGVIFIREIAAKWALVEGANRVVHEHYQRCPTSHHIAAGRYEYKWRVANDWDSVSARMQGALSTPGEETHEHFLKERAYGYSPQPDGSCLEFHVVHPCWRCANVIEPKLTLHAPDMFGAEFRGVLSEPPASAFLAEGSAVQAFWMDRFRS